MEIIQKKLSDMQENEISSIESFLNYNFSTVFHEPEFNRSVSEVFKTEFSYYLAYNNDGKLIALCPLHTFRTGLLETIYSSLSMYDIPYGGWIYNNKEISLLELIQNMKLTPNEALNYWSAPQIENDDYMFLEDRKEFQTGIIDLSLSLDDILQKCIGRKRRQSINSALRKGVVVEKLNLNSLGIFLEQCNFLRSSVGLKDLPSDFFIRLFSQYYDAGKIIAFAAKLDNNYLASGVMIGNQYITHLWIAGKPKNLSVNVPRQDLIVWESIKWAKQNRSRYFDLCYVETEGFDARFKFKLGFSKKIVPFYYITKKKVSYRIISRIQRFFN